MSAQPGEALVRQCARRLRVCCPGADVDGEDAPRRAAQIITHNRRRIPGDQPPDPATGVPDAHVDAVLRTIVAEGPRIAALRAGDDVAWAAMLALVDRRVRARLRRVYAGGAYLTPFDDLADDLTLRCVARIWERLDAYPFDAPLDAWISRFVHYEVSAALRRAAFRHNARARSLDAPLTPHAPDARSLGDTLPDRRAAHLAERLDVRLAVEAGMAALPPDQREVVRRGLAGQPVPHIARVMGRTRNAVYVLRHRAIAALRTFVAG
jgi:DNA-directed RNA polymerase specialized sigma24 family protein